MNNVKIGILGSSNSAIKNGYFDLFVSKLNHKTDNDFVVFHKRTVGATTIFNALKYACQSDFYEHLDVLFLDFFINDTVAFSKKSYLVEHWAKAYEGLLRKVFLKNPKIKIFSFGFSQLNGLDTKRINPLFAYAKVLSSRYNAFFINVNEILISSYPSLYNSEKMYSDKSHYSRPFGVDIISSVLSDYVLDKINNARKEISFPKPIYVNNYSHCKYIDDLSFFSNNNIKKFENKMISEKALVIGDGSHLDINISGHLLMFDFISTPSSPVIDFALPNSIVKSYTCRSTFVDGKFKILYSCIVPECHVDNKLSGHNVPFRLNVSDNQLCLSNKKENEAFGTFVPPLESECGDFFLIGILYLGRIY